MRFWNGDYVHNMWANRPDFLKLNNDLLFQVNNRLSIVHLYGKISMDNGGISSPHLHGTFSISMRRAGTGFYALDQTIPLDDANAIALKQATENAFEWFKQNNPLYRHFLEPPSAEEFVMKLRSAEDVLCTVIMPMEAHDRAAPWQVPVLYKNPQGEGAAMYVSIESVICGTFLDKLSDKTFVKRLGSYSYHIPRHIVGVYSLPLSFGCIVC